MSRRYSRRAFFITSLKGTAALAGVALIAEACTPKDSSPESKKPADPCEDFTGIEEAELEKRKQFAYVKQAPDANKPCKSCKLFLPPKQGEKCGGCMLFKGPVDPAGSCTYWAPLD